MSFQRTYGCVCPSSNLSSRIPLHGFGGRCEGSALALPSPLFAPRHSRKTGICFCFLPSEPALHSKLATEVIVVKSKLWKLEKIYLEQGEFRYVFLFEWLGTRRRYPTGRHWTILFSCLKLLQRLLRNHRKQQQLRRQARPQVGSLRLPLEKSLPV